MRVQATRTRQMTLQPLMQLELLIASLLPVTGIFLVIVVGTKLIVPNLLVPFIAFSIVCAIAIFFAEFALISLMQRAIKEQFSDLIAICQAYMAGNKESRAIVYGDTELTTILAQTLNALLDFTTVQEKYYASRKTVSETNDEPLKKRVKQFILEIAPAMNTNLRAQTEKAAGDTGLIIDISTYIAKEFIQHLKLTHSATQLIIETISEAINRSIDLAQTSETLLIDFSQTTERVEKLVAFMQRLSGMLQLYVESTQETPRTPFVIPKDNSFTDVLADETSTDGTITGEKAILVDKLPAPSEDTVSQQTQLLEEALSSLQEQTLVAESLIEEFYNFAQGMHQSNTGVLNVVERISSLVNLAEQLDHSTALFQFPNDDYQNYP